MAEIRLSKLTKRFNIGLQTLVDFLNEKGAGVETNPNAKVSDEYLPALEKKFESDLKASLEASNEVIKMKEIIEKNSRRQTVEDEYEPERETIIKTNSLSSTTAREEPRKEEARPAAKESAPAPKEEPKPVVEKAPEAPVEQKAPQAAPEPPAKEEAEAKAEPAEESQPVEEGTSPQRKFHRRRSPLKSEAPAKEALPKSEPVAAQPVEEKPQPEEKQERACTISQGGASTRPDPGERGSEACGEGRAERTRSQGRRHRRPQGSRQGRPHPVRGPQEKEEEGEDQQGRLPQG